MRIIHAPLVLACSAAWFGAAEVSQPPAAPAAAAKAAAKAAAEAAARREVEAHTVTVVSSRDGASQKVLFEVPPAAAPDGAGEPVPLLVALHTWSADYTQSVVYLELARRRGWAVACPDFRGPNNRPEACASDLAVGDVLDAVAYARDHARVDPDRTYLVGGSGGGHMALVMAGRAPTLWAGVSAWCPITDLAAWHAFHAPNRSTYAKMLEQACGGPPGTPATDAQYRARSPLTWLAAAAGVTLDINAGIHDGHTGSVPVSHALRAFNCVVAAAGCSDRQVAEDDIAAMVRDQRPPDALAGERQSDPERSKAVLFRRVVGAVRVTLFEGGHDYETGAALAWLARQRRGTPARFEVPATSAPGAAAQPVGQ